MMFFLPIFICAGIGFAAGMVCHRIWQPFWVATFRATLAATVIWTVGVYVLLAVTAPNELGPPVPVAILQIALLTFVSAAGAGAVMKFRPSRKA